MEQTNQKIEVVYKKAKLGKRLFGYFIDISLFLLTTFILFSITNMGITKTSWFVAKQNRLIQLRNESGLYVNNIVIYTYLTNDKTLTDEYRKNEISSRIDTFYQNTTYITNVEKVNEQYTARKLKATHNSAHLFITNEYDEVVENPVIAYSTLFNFYKGEVEDVSLAYLIKNPTYFRLVQFSFLTSVVEFIILLLITFTLYYLIFPLFIFKRGRQTIGMKLAKVGLISVYADNIEAGKFVGRFFFNLGVFILLDFVAFLIPAIISITMMFINKANQNLVNYVFNDYAVDVENQTIYLSAAEREESEFKLQQMSIENKDLRLK